MVDKDTPLVRRAEGPAEAQGFHPVSPGFSAASERNCHISKAFETSLTPLMIITAMPVLGQSRGRFSSE
jgi:hypothetical protein